MKIDSYSELAMKLGAPVSRRFLALLEATMTSDEARLCCELFVPATAPELASRLSLDDKIVAKMLESLVNRGITYQRQDSIWFSHQPVSLSS